MRAKDITWDHVTKEYVGLPLFQKWCNLNSCCEECDAKVRFWCRVKSKITEHQKKLIRRILNKRSIKK